MSHRDVGGATIGVLAVLVAGCSGGSPEQLGERFASRTATVALTLGAWQAGSLPERFTDQALDRAENELALAEEAQETPVPARLTARVGHVRDTEALAACPVVDRHGRMAGRLAGIEVAARDCGYVVESFVIDHHPLLNRFGAWTVPREILAALPFTRPGSHRVRWQDVDLSDAARPRLRVAASRVTRAPAEAA